MILRLIARLTDRRDARAYDAALVAIAKSGELDRVLARLGAEGTNG